VLVTSDALAVIGMTTMTLGLPLIAVGLSFSSPSETAGVAVIIPIGSIVTYLLTCVTWIWPEFEPAPRPLPQLLPEARAFEYGLRLGLRLVWPRCSAWSPAPITSVGRRLRHCSSSVR
jgi:hypothetical protein